MKYSWTLNGIAKLSGYLSQSHPGTFPKIFFVLFDLAPTELWSNSFNSKYIFLYLSPVLSTSTFFSSSESSSSSCLNSPWYSLNNTSWFCKLTSTYLFNNLIISLAFPSLKQTTKGILRFLALTETWAKISG